jgi:hypothetical protein
MDLKCSRQEIHKGDLTEHAGIDRRRRLRRSQMLTLRHAKVTMKLFMSN